MNILLLGSGGREHAIAHKIAQSAQCSHLYIAPGNAGTAAVGENVALDMMDFEAVGAFALDHRVACYGYVFTERQGLPHIRRDMIDYLHIPFHAIRAIKEGAGWERPDGGGFVPHERLVTPADAPRSYAYLSDTRPLLTLANKIAPPTLLYHEATYTELHAADAALRYHSTARGAATVAQALCAQQLLIGHFSSRYEKDEQPILDEARALFPNTRLANEGLRLTL